MEFWQNVYYLMYVQTQQFEGSSDFGYSFYVGKGLSSRWSLCKIFYSKSRKFALHYVCILNRLERKEIHKFRRYIYIYIYIFIFNGCSTIIFEQVLIIPFSLERFCFPGGTVVHNIIIRLFKAYLSVWKFLGHKLRKNLSILTNFGYVFHVNNLRSYTKNCNRMIDTFYRATSKPLLIHSF